MFKLVQHTAVLEKNFEMINMKKWMQPISQGAKQLQYFSLRGFYLGICCESLGFNLFRAAPKDAPHADGSSFYVKTSDNQLVKSASEFNDISNYHKQTMIIRCCRHLGATHSPSDCVLFPSFGHSSVDRTLLVHVD